MQAVPAALDTRRLEGDLGLLDQPGPQQDPVAGHADDVALETAEIGQEDLDGLLFAVRPAFGDPFVPERDFLLGARERAIVRPVWLAPDANEIRPPIRGRRGELGLPGDLVDAGGLARD